MVDSNSYVGGPCGPAERGRGRPRHVYPGSDDRMTSWRAGDQPSLDGRATTGSPRRRLRGGVDSRCLGADHGRPALAGLGWWPSSSAMSRTGDVLIGGSCDERVPYGPVTDTLKLCSGAGGGPAGSRQAGVSSALSCPSFVSRPTSRYRALAGTAARRCASTPRRHGPGWSRGPVVEDLHWSDASNRNLLLSCYARSGMPLLVVATCRMTPSRAVIPLSLPGRGGTASHGRGHRAGPLEVADVAQTWPRSWGARPSR